MNPKNNFVANLHKSLKLEWFFPDICKKGNLNSFNEQNNQKKTR